MNSAAHPEIVEDYEKDLEDGVEDDASLDEQGAHQLSIASYGADYTVDSLVERMRTGAFIIPQFQRKFIWSQRHASKFIESLLMGLPVPGLFLYRQPDQGTHLVIDGQQRLTSLTAFYDGNFREKKFRLLGVREPWTDKSYDDLIASDQLRLDEAIIHATIFQQDNPEDVLSSIYYVFERINSGGITLSPQEIRNCVNQGKLLDVIRRLNSDANWRTIFGPENNRLKDEELILRFMAMLSSSDSYKRPMSEFLNNFVADHSATPEKELKSLARAFKETIKTILESIGKKAFRSVRVLNVAVFDSVMVGLARRLSESRKRPTPSHVAAAYETLLDNTDYRRACERATADEESVQTRLRLATEAFAHT